MENFKNKDSFFTTILREKNAKMFFYASLLPLHHTFTQTYIYLHGNCTYYTYSFFLGADFKHNQTTKQLNNFI